MMRSAKGSPAISSPSERANRLCAVSLAQQRCPERFGRLGFAHEWVRFFAAPGVHAPN